MWYQRSQCYLDKLFNFSTLYTVTFSPFLALEQARARRWARTQGSRVCFSSIAKIAPESPLLCLYVPGCQQLLPNCFLERAWGMGPPCPGSPLGALRQSRLLPPHCPGGSSALTQAAHELLQLEASPEQNNVWEKHQDSSGNQRTGREKQLVLPSRILKLVMGWGTRVCQNLDK